MPYRGCALGHRCRRKIPVICRLIEGKHRLEEMRRSIDGISQPMLAQNLRELEREGIVAKNLLPDSPPRVE